MIARLAVLAALAVAMAGCGGGDGPAPAATPAPRDTASSGATAFIGSLAADPAGGR